MAKRWLKRKGPIVVNANSSFQYIGCSIFSAILVPFDDCFVAVFLGSRILHRSDFDRGNYNVSDQTAASLETSEFLFRLQHSAVSLIFYLES